MLDILASAIGLAVPGFLYVTLIGKLLDWEEFRGSISTFTLLPSWVQSVAEYGVPIGEALPFVLVCRSKKRPANLVAGLFLLFVTAVVAWHRVRNVEPTCACLGMWSKYFSVQHETGAILIRNSCLMAVCVLDMLMPDGAFRSNRSDATPRVPSIGSEAVPETSERRRGFTLVELLCSIAIIVILISLVSVGVAKSRLSAKSAASLSNLRSHAAAFLSYAASSQDYFPYFTKPGFASTTLGDGEIRLDGVSYFDAHRTWHIALASSHYNLPASASVFFPPGIRKEFDSGWPYYTRYAYACVFIATPEYWNPYTRVGPSQFRGTKVSDVLYAGQKVLLNDTWYWGQEASAGRSSAERLLSVQVDGSGRNSASSDHLAGYQFGDGHELIRDGAVHGADAPSLLHTIDGVRGRDFR